MTRRPGFCLATSAVIGVVLLALVAGAVWIAYAISYKPKPPRTDPALPRRGPEALCQAGWSLPALGWDAAGRFVAERKPRAGEPGAPGIAWERVYESDLAQDGRIVLRVDAARERILEAEIGRPAAPLTPWKLIDSTWGLPKSEVDRAGDRHLYVWQHGDVPGTGCDAEVTVVAFWTGKMTHGPLDAVRWTPARAGAGAP